MSALLDLPPYAARDERGFLAEMNALVAHHRAGCEEYVRGVGAFSPAGCVADLPYLHTGVFKHVHLVTHAEGVKHTRTLLSSATTGAQSSRISMDEGSSALQARSSLAILTDFLGVSQRPLLVLDSAQSLRRRGEVSARIAAALSLKPLASDIMFALDDEPTGTDCRVNWAVVRCALDQSAELLVYGFTWVLWRAFVDGVLPEDIAKRFAQTRIDFVHSGGWKKLEALRVSQQALERGLLDQVSIGSRVIDFYGLVEQNGVVFPLCPQGARHVPRWADVVVRNPTTLEPTADIGMLQLLNTLSRGAPTHSVLTEDLGRLLIGECACGRLGRRFELLGRIPKAEARGCANV